MFYKFLHVVSTIAHTTAIILDIPSPSKKSNLWNHLLSVLAEEPMSLDRRVKGYTFFLTVPAAAHFIEMNHSHSSLIDIQYRNREG